MYLLTCAPRKHSNQSGWSKSLLGTLLIASDTRSLRSDNEDLWGCATSKAVLSLNWTHKSGDIFSHVKVCFFKLRSKTFEWCHSSLKILLELLWKVLIRTSLCDCKYWSRSSLFATRFNPSLLITNNENPGQTARICRLVCRLSSDYVKSHILSYLPLSHQLRNRYLQESFSAV